MVDNKILRMFLELCSFEMVVVDVMVIGVLVFKGLMFILVVCSFSNVFWVVVINFGDFYSWVVMVIVVVLFGVSLIGDRV